MKATGIVRRIDDLGRVVIPREVRKSLGIKENDLLDIFIEDGGVVFMPCKDSLADEVDTLKKRLSDNFKYDLTKQQKIKNLMDEVFDLIKE